MSYPTPSPGPGLFVGWQDRSNSIGNPPPRPYLVRLDGQVTVRARYAGHQGVRTWRGGDLFLDFRGGSIESLTVNGSPLYLWQGDTKAGDATGQDKNGFYAVMANGVKYDPGAKTSSTGS